MGALCVSVAVGWVNWIVSVMRMVSMRSMAGEDVGLLRQERIEDSERPDRKARSDEMRMAVFFIVIVAEIGEMMEMGIVGRIVVGERAGVGDAKVMLRRGENEAIMGGDFECKMLLIFVDDYCIWG